MPSPTCRQPIEEGASGGCSAGLGRSRREGVRCWAKHWGKVFAQEEDQDSGTSRYRDPASDPGWVQMGDSDRGFLESVLETLPLRSNSNGNEHRLANTWH